MGGAMDAERHRPQQPKMNTALLGGIDNIQRQSFKLLCVLVPYPSLVPLFAGQANYILSRGEGHALDAFLVDIHYDSSQDSLAIFAARVEANGATQLM